MARLVATLPPARPGPVRQSSATAFPIPRPTRPLALPDKGRSNPGLWKYFELPEVFKVATWIGQGVSRISFAPALDVPGQTGDRCPALVNPDGTVVEGVSERLARDAQAAWSMIRSPFGGQAELWGSLAVCLNVAGDGWLFTYPADPISLAYDPAGPPIWVAMARHALDTRGEFYEVDVGAEAKVKVPIDDAQAIRVWRSHPQKLAQALSWVSSAQRTLEVMEAIYEAIAATALSRLNAGVILAPDDQDRRGVGAMVGEAIEVAAGEGRDLHAELSSLLADHVESSAAELDGFARAVPATIGLNSSLIDSVTWLQLARDMDKELGERINDLRYRLAINSPAPPEMLLGLGDSNHWNNEAVTTAEYQKTIQPECEVLCRMVTPFLLHPLLAEMGYGGAELASIRVGYDPSALVDPPDRSEVALKLAALPIPLITPAEARDATGMGEYAGPDEEEQTRMLAERLLMARPEFGHLLPLVGLPAPPASGGEGSAETAVDASSTLAVVAAPALPAARTAAAVPPPDSSSPAPALTDLALRFEDRIAVLFGAIIDRMVERASSQVMSMSRRSSWTPVREALKAAPPAMRGAVPGVTTLLAADGIDDTDLLGGALAAFAGRFEAETKRGQREAVKLAGGEWAELEADAEQSSAAAWALAATLLIAEARRRFDADLPPEEVGEGRSDASAFAVPPLLVRRVSAVAGGEPDVGPNAEGGAAGPLLSIATGALAQRAAASAGLVVDGWTWDYGEEERATFEPHLDLDGTFSPDPFDFGGFYVGDHNGCRCRAVPHLVPASEVGAGTSEETAP